MSYKENKPIPEKNQRGFNVMTEKFCSELCDFNGYYSIPKFNYNLYLHYYAFTKIENLDNFINLRVLYLENNCIRKIENISHLKNLMCLYYNN